MDDTPQRLRFVFSKGENLRYISHLDLSRTWERALRRAGIPVAYSKGFHPHPKIVFASALPVGCTGEAEVMDVVLSEPMPPRRVLRGVAHGLPDGLEVVDVISVYDRAPALPSLLCGADYESLIETQRLVEEVSAQGHALLACNSIPREFRNKRYDLRPLIDDLEILKVNARYLLVRMQLAAGSRGTGRPDEVLDALGLADLPHSCHRRRLRFSQANDE